MLHCNRFVDIVVYFKQLCKAGERKNDERLKKNFPQKENPGIFSFPL